MQTSASVSVLVLVLVLVLVSAAWSASVYQVGVLYEPWHGYASYAMSQVEAMGGTQLSVERVIRSNGEYLMSDILDKYGLRATADSFFYHVTPELGFYCIYRHRPSETGYIPDCSNITGTLTQQAQWLVDAGVDYIVVDSSNLPVMTTEADVIQVRPTEVLFEEWYKLRLQGIQTPSIAIWPCIPTGANVYEYYLNIYNNESYSDLVMRDPRTNKKVMFIVDPPDSGRLPDSQILAEIQSNDISTVMMWALFAQTQYSKGDWGFFTPCQSNGMVDVTSIVGESCNQPETTNSPIGSEVSAAPSFQVSYASLPGCGAGKLNGLTLKKQFQTVFQDQPDYVFLSSWNEFIAQPQSNPYWPSVSNGFSMGLYSDPNRDLWVDTYGSHWGRDIEPSLEYGYTYYNLMASCIRVFKSGSHTCSGSSEECCNTAEGFSNIWSLHYSQSDYLLTASEYEKNILVSEGWAEVCNHFSGSSVFCVDSSANQGQTASFIMFSDNASDHTAIYRCMTSSDKHFFSTDSNCEGTTQEGLLGYVQTWRGGVALRSLYRCYNKSTGVHYHSLDVPCPSDQYENMYGYAV
ncbi:hypothetical protein Pelo_2047 [Pelomyxa schiedti]|nr:hypothetical protein Pelo_2047 [Pelomyxa schiedti]